MGGMGVGALLSGFLGALIVFVVGAAREWWRNERVRRGVLRLLLAEIKHNEIVIGAIRDSGTSLPTSPYLDALKTQTWDESREAAAGLPPELLNALVSYYEPLEIFRTLRSLPDLDPDREPQNAIEMVNRSFEPLRESINRLLGLPLDRRESYEHITLRAQARAKARIAGYLGRPLLWAPIAWRAGRWRRWWAKRRRKPPQIHEHGS
jgi:hypothetical protein